MAVVAASTDRSRPETEVVIAQGRLEVRYWDTQVPEIVKFFEERAAAVPEGRSADLAGLLENALRIGVLALRATGLSVNVDYIEREFQRLVGQVEGELDRRVREMSEALEKIFGKDGALGRALNQYLGEGGQVADLFNPDRRDSAVSRIKELLAAHLDGEGSTLYKTLDLTNPNSPLHKWREELRQGFNEIKTQLENYRTEVETRLAAQQARVEALEKSALKGGAYQDLVFEATSRIARHFGDSVEPTGDLPEIDGSKVGDVVVTVNPRDTGGAPARLVLEAKDRLMGLTPILRELEEARKNRGATAAIAVYSRADLMPAGTGPFSEHGVNLYLCLYEKENPDAAALELAYRAARFWAMRDLARAEARAVDPGKAREEIAAARKLLASFASIKGKITQIKTAVGQGTDELENELGRLREGLSQAFDRMDAYLTGTADT
jgi:hypothetical protein